MNLDDILQKLYDWGWESGSNQASDWAWELRKDKNEHLDIDEAKAQIEALIADEVKKAKLEVYNLYAKLKEQELQSTLGDKNA